MSSTSLQSMLTPESTEGVTETINLKSPASGKSAGTSASLRSADWLSAVVHVCFSGSDILFVNGRHAADVLLQWPRLEEESSDRISNLTDLPLASSDLRTGLVETAALAFEGLRCTLLSTETNQDRIDSAPPLGAPFVTCVAGVDQMFRPAYKHFELAARTTQEVTDFLVIAQAISEISLCPGVVRIEQDSNEFFFRKINLLTGEQLLSILGAPADRVDAPTAYQRSVFGAARRRIPTRPTKDIDPGLLMKDLHQLSDSVFAHFAEVTGRSYERTDAEDKQKVKRGRVGSGLIVNVQSVRSIDLARRLAAGAVTAGANSATVVTIPATRQVSISIGSKTNAKKSGKGSVHGVIIAGAKRRGLGTYMTSLAVGGTIIIEGIDQDPEEIWQSFSDSTRATISEKKLRVLAFDAAEGINAAERIDDTLSHDTFETSLVSLMVSKSFPDAAPDEHNFLELAWSDYDTPIDFYHEDRVLYLRRRDSDHQGPEDTQNREVGDSSLRNLLAFYRNGEDTGSRVDDSGLIPLSLYPYLNSPRIREPYPFCLITEGEGIAVPLSGIIDNLITSADADANKDELTKHLLKLETEIRQHARDHPEMLLSEMWDLSMDSAVVSDLGVSIPDLPEVDGRMLGFSQASLTSLIDRAHGHHWDIMLASVRKNCESLVIQLDEILRHDFSESSEGRAPDHLQASVGKAFADELDFEALSEVMEQTSHSAELSQKRRARLRSVSTDLKQLPLLLETARSTGIFSGAASLSRAVANVRQNRRIVASLSKAVHIARLESTGKYNENRHDRFFAQFGVDKLTPEEISVCPPCVVSIESTELSNPLARGELMQVLSSDMPIKVILFVDHISSGIARTSNSGIADVAMQAVSLGTAYVFQSPGSKLDAIINTVQKGASWHGPSLYSTYIGPKLSVDTLDSYMASAVSLESRAFPVFEFDPSGRDWADRFTIQENPDIELSWGKGEVEVKNGAVTEPMPALFTFGDFLACDTRYSDHFRAVKQEMWHPGMTPLDKFVEMNENPEDSPENTVKNNLAENAPAEDISSNDASSEDTFGEKNPADDVAEMRVPFLWMADEIGQLHRVTVTHQVVEATREIQTRWNTLQELGGVRSSHAARLIDEAANRLEQEKNDAIEEIKRQYETDLARSQGEVARDIVSNIAAGLLGLQSATGRSAATNDQPIPRPTEPVGEVEIDGTDATSESAETSGPAVTSESDEEEVEIIAMDDPYIDTVRCTTCNECTNINPQMFAYDDNQQAYILDATAGSFRELVDSAELCPVKIIRPGKPLNPDEPGLDELIERAKPYQ